MEGKITDYKILTSYNDREYLTRKVKNLLKQEWEPLGPVSVAKDIFDTQYSQAMCFRSKKK